MIGLKQPFILAELLYVVFISIFCFMIYSKTNKINKLTDHKGIKYFRVAFLYFGLAYVTRFLVFLGIMSFKFLDSGFSFRMIQPLSLTIMAYFSTMAILFIFYSLFWKNMEETNFLMVSNTLAFLLSLFCFATRTHSTLFIIHILLVLVLAAFLLTKRKKKKFSKIIVLYILTFVFWILNLAVLDQKFTRQYDWIWGLQAMSILVFILIFYKLNKLIK